MKFSKLFTKTNKTARDYDSKNATFLEKGAFINRTMAGVYSYLPLGLRVLNKIENIVREEMDKIGDEISMPNIAPKELWEKTGRLETVDVLMKTVPANEKAKAKHDAEYILNPTQEDIVTPIAAMFNQSYKDFPFAVYQIQYKYRNEPRAKGGIMRGREFRMKDLYSFHLNEKDLLDYYHNQAKPAYVKVFERVGLGDHTVIALASGGDFTDEYSHEFQTICDAGEDLLFYDEKNHIYYNREVTPSKAPDIEYESSDMKDLENIFGEHIVGMDELVKFLKVPADHCVKTLIYQADDEIVVAAVRGNYDVDEEKLKDVLNCKSLELASEDKVKEITGAEIGYAGIINLPEDVKRIFDDALENMINFECGTNKTNYHTINVNWGRDLEKPEKFYDIKVAQEGDLNPETGKPYKTFKASEVGNIFPLNTKFTDSFDYTYMDQNGKPQKVYMGSYGIGTTRLMGVVVETLSDENGILWPMSISPFQVHLVSLRGGEEEAEKLYNELIDSGVEVLWDERDESPGAKFTDADLIGIPIRLVVSKKSLEAGGVEVKMRHEDDSEIIELEKIGDWVKEKIESEMEKFI